MKFWFIHVNKCGGKSIDQALKKSLDDYQEIHGLVGSVSLNSSRNYILFVRDPIQRFISSYKYHQQCRGQVLRTHVQKNGDINDFIDQIKKSEVVRKKAFRINLHLHYSLGEYVSEKAARDLQFYFVGTTENIKRDFVKLVNKLRKDQQCFGLMKLDHFNRTNKRNRCIISEENVRYLRELYANDYKIMKILTERGYLSQEYYDKITTQRFYYS